MANLNKPISPAEANRLLYAEIAEEYDRNLDAHRKTVARHVDEVLAMAGRREKVLDACGGSGNVSLVLLDRGIDPVLVDVSPDLLRIYEKKAAQRGHRTEFHETTIESFLQTDVRTWDIIFFVAALHHLEDFMLVLRLAAQRLSPGGLLATFNDPIEVGRVGCVLRRMDYYLHVAFHKPSSLPHAIGRKLRYLAARRRNQPALDYGSLAELHAVSGVNDLQLVEELRRLGMAIIKHRRKVDANLAVSRALFQLFRKPAEFAIIARRPEDEGDVDAKYSRS